MKGEINIDGLFHKAANQPVVSSFGETKELFLSTVGKMPTNIRTKRTRVITPKKTIIMIAILSTVIVSLMLIQSEPKQDKIENNSPEKVEGVLVSDTIKVENEVVEPTIIEVVPEYEYMAPMIDMMEEFLNIDPIVELKVEPPHFDYHVEQSYDDQPYTFPILTEEEIAANHKRKKKMVKAMSKHDKKYYAYIPSGTLDYHGIKTSVQAFYMQTAEVSNIQYKTFLFDLLIHDRKDEFLKAKPDQGKWAEIPGTYLEPMKEQYFSEEAYDDYPVVNVSREGAEMYCIWLTTETNNYSKRKGQILMNDLRIPMRAEWEIAASSGGTQMPFPWGGPLAQNLKGCFLANYDPSLKGELMDPSKCEDCDTINESFSDGAMLTAKTKTYNPNAFGLYNMSGNVAEMVYDKNKSSGTAGGGWMSSFDAIKIDGKDEYSELEEGHPNVGFRVVMTYLNSTK